MKQKDLVRLLTENGFTQVRNGSKHDIYAKGDCEVQVPRHKEVNELTAKSVLKRAGIK